MATPSDAEPGTAGAAPPLSFAELLRRHRLAAGFSQEELAERAGLSPRGVIYLERGGRQPYRAPVGRCVRLGGRGVRCLGARGRLGRALGDRR